MFSEPSVLRVTAAVAAATAAVGAAVMRRWDVEAGKRVADLTRARASDEWRHEERVAELETDLDESRELRTKLEHKLRAKRTELAGLRNEHAALLRRYATAETERASALEGRRLLEIEATAPEEARELPAAGVREDAGGSDKARPAAEASPVPPQGVPAAGAPWASWETASKAAAKAAEAVEAAKAAKTAKSGASEDVPEDAPEDAPDDGAVAAPAGAGAGGSAADGDAADGADEAAGAESADEEALIAAGTDEADSGAGEGPLEDTGEKSESAPVFSPSGSGLFLRANSALDRIITQRGSAEDREEGAETTGEAETRIETETETRIETETETRIEAETGIESVSEGDEQPEPEPEAEAEAEVGTVDMTGPEAVAEPEAEPVSEATLEPESRAVQSPDEAAAPADAEAEGAPAAAENAAEPELPAEPAPAGTTKAGTTKAGADASAKDRDPKGGSPKGPSPKGDPDGPTDGGTRQGRSAEPAQDTAAVLTAEEDDATGKSVAVRGHERAAADPVPAVTAPAPSTGAGELTRVEPSGRALPALPPAGHFTVPTAVAVVPATPQRRAAVEGGFDFFGTQKGADALEAVQNEDLADVVGQEALALHKAESEARFKQADEASRGVGQVIDLTAHDETEQIDLKGLRTAAS
ncbi:hypothetical protein ABZ517_17530 [Streptomyces scabiei]